MKYVHLANGDFNDERYEDLDLGDIVECEMTLGYQSWVLVTQNKLTPDQYGKIQEFIDKTMGDKTYQITIEQRNKIQDFIDKTTGEAK